MSDLIVPAKSAQVQVATASLNVVTINNKQMTLAVFRQLRRHQLIVLDSEKKPEFAGEMWGTVNYHGIDEDWHYGHGKCSEVSRPSHLHVIWKYEDQLVKSTIQLCGLNAVPSLMQAEGIDILARSGPNEGEILSKETLEQWDRIDLLQLWLKLGLLPQLFIAV